MSIRTLQGFIRSLGTAKDKDKDDTHHWWLQRVTSVALIPLVLWFVISLLSVSRVDHEAFQQWLGNPLNALLMIVLMLGAFYHASLGMQVIYEDYVRPEDVKIAVLFTRFVLFLLGAVSVVSVLTVAFAA